VLEKDHTNVPALTNKGVCFYNLGKVKEAMDCYDKALAINPDDRIVLQNKINILEKFGDKYELQINLMKSKLLSWNVKSEMTWDEASKSQIDSPDKKTTESRVTLDNDDLLKILKIRLAKGEITMDEFKELKDIL
jgi:tetratricopeptide (TPR) repeat protein